MICRKLFIVPLLFGMIKANAAYDTSDVVKAYVGASIKYDSNLYRRGEGDEGSTSSNLPSRSDTIVEARAGVKIDKQLSLQTVGLDLNVYAPNYFNSDHVNYTGWKNTAYWNWVIGKRFSGTLRYQDVKALSGFDDVVVGSDVCGDAADIFVPNDDYIVDIYRDKRINFDAGWLIGHNFKLGASLSRVDNTHDQRSCLDQVQTGYVFSAAFISNKGNQLSLYAGQTDIDFKRDMLLGLIPASERGYKQNEVGMAVKWLYSPRTEFNASLGQSGLSFASGDTGPDSRIGSISMLWRQSPKTIWMGRYQRMLESGTDRAGRNLLDEYQLRLDWAASSKVAAYANGRYLQREYDTGSTQSAPSLAGREDRDTSLELGLNYRPWPALTLTPYLTVLRRDANVDDADYSANVFGFTGQWWF